MDSNQAAGPTTRENTLGTEDADDQRSVGNGANGRPNDQRAADNRANGGPGNGEADPDGVEQQAACPTDSFYSDPDEGGRSTGGERVGVGKDVEPPRPLRAAQLLGPIILRHQHPWIFVRVQRRQQPPAEAMRFSLLRTAFCPARARAAQMAAAPAPAPAPDFLLLSSCGNKRKPARLPGGHHLYLHGPLSSESDINSVSAFWEQVMCVAEDVYDNKAQGNPPSAAKIKQVAPFGGDLVDYTATVTGAAGGCRVASWLEVHNSLYIRLFVEWAPPAAKEYVLEKLEVGDNTLPLILEIAHLRPWCHRDWKALRAFSFLLLSMGAEGAVLRGS